MYSLIHFITKYNAVILFIFFEAVCFYLIVNYNQEQRSALLSSSNTVTGYVGKKKSAISSYINLKQQNKALEEENARLLSELYNRTPMDQEQKDSIEVIINENKSARYAFTSAKVITNSVGQRINHMTIDRGKLDGLEEGMGVIGINSVVGYTSNCNSRYCQVLSILSESTNISAKLVNSQAFGNLQWQPWDTRYVYLNKVPKHYDVKVGEEVVTSGYSMIFPEGIHIGVVAKVSEKKGANELDIKVELDEDIMTTRSVQIVSFKKKPAFRNE